MKNEITVKSNETIKNNSKEKLDKIYEAIKELYEEADSYKRIQNDKSMTEKKLKEFCFRPDENVRAFRNIKNASKREIEEDDIAVVLSDDKNEDSISLWAFGIEKVYHFLIDSIVESYEYKEIEDVRWSPFEDEILIACKKKENEKENEEKFGIRNFDFPCRGYGARLIHDAIWEAKDIARKNV